MDIVTIRRDLEEAEQKLAYWSDRKAKLARFWDDLVDLYPETAGLARLDSEADPLAAESRGLVDKLLHVTREKELRGQADVIASLNVTEQWLSPLEMYERLCEQGRPRSTYAPDPSAATRKSMARAAKVGQILVRARNHRENEYHRLDVEVSARPSDENAEAPAV